MDPNRVLNNLNDYLLICLEQTWVEKGTLVFPIYTEKNILNAKYHYR